MKFDRFGESGDYTEPLRPLDPLIHALRKERYTQNLSQNELARRIVFTKRSLSAAENGTTAPNFYLMKSWAKALGMKLEMVKE